MSDGELEYYEKIEVSEEGENEEGGLTDDWVVVKGRREKQSRNPTRWRKRAVPR